MENYTTIGTRIAILVIAATALLQVGCHSVRRGEPITGLVSGADPAVARGRIVFMQNCHQCHPNGEGGLGPALNDKLIPKFMMKTQVRAGLGVMPSFHKEKISPEQLDDLMRYILALRNSD